MASALNALLRASSDVDVNYCLGPGGEKILDALVKLFDEALGWNDDGDDDGADPNSTNDQEEDGDEKYNNLEPKMATWDAASLSGKHERWRNFCRDKLASPLASCSDPNKLIDPETDTRILDMIIAILRNLSYVAQNLRFLYHNEGILRILTGALYYRGYSAGGSGTEDSRSGEDVPSSLHHSNMCVHSLHTLINMAPLIDVTGRQYFIDKVFMESDAKEVLCTFPYQELPPKETEEGAEGTTPAPMPKTKKGYPKYGLSSILGFGGMHLAKQYDTKAETLENIPDSEVWGLVGYHVRAMLAIFPELLSLLDPNDVTATSTAASGLHRPSVQAVLELLTALLENEDNKGIFLCVPDSVLHRLTEMLYMPRLGPESLDYIDPVSNTVTRVVALKLMIGYDATIDSDMRDRACDLLVKLTDLTTILKRRLGMASTMSGMARRQYSDSTASSGEMTPSILRSDESSSPRRMNIRLYDSLLSMLSSSAGRGESGSLAVRLLSNLALVPENKPGILYVERKLISMAGKDPNIANIACNGIFNRVK